MDSFEWLDAEIAKETVLEKLWLLRVARVHARTSLSEYMKCQRIISDLYLAPGAWKDYSVPSDYQI